MELRIDGVPCDLGDEPIVVPGYEERKMTEIGAAREGRSLRITLPRSPRNDLQLCDECELYAGERFNGCIRYGEVRAEGVVLLEGPVRLLAVSTAGYAIEIRDGGAEWASMAARHTLDELEIDYRARLLPETIEASWTDASPVKFFPVRRDEYPRQSGSQDLLPAQRLLTVDDYHPFLHLATMVERIFGQAGYRTESSFLRSDFFRSLYMSGAYASRETAAAEARMGFFARRLGSVTAAASAAGRVYADPLAEVNTVGNIVETATPQTLDADGEPVPELYDNGHGFGLENGMIRFRPVSEVSVGFEYFLRYTTDHRILSRTRLKGFDSIYLGPGSEMRFELPNRYEDCRGDVRPGTSYRVVVFDHAAGNRYRLTCFRNGGSSETTWATFASRSLLLSTPSAGATANPTLWIMRDDAWVLYSGDWALYEGYVGETGQTTVEVRVRTAAEIVSPSSPKYFHAIQFFGAEAGMSLTLDKHCSLQPRFLAAPGYGATLAFADVARHRIRQSELLEAVAHLFNLRFYTEEPTRTVWIEPADDFYGAGPGADWSGRSDLDAPVVRIQGAPEVHELRTWCYQPADGAVARCDRENGTETGAWSRQTESAAAMQGEERLRNPVFRPTLSVAGLCAEAPSALVPDVGDRDATDGDGINFSPRIVRYAGMHPLPGGQRWGYPSYGGSYPLAAFHFAGDEAAEPFTLGFEDRDGAAGLHRYHDRQAAREAEGERIGLTLRMAPHEFAGLFAPGTGAAEVRSVFLIGTGRGTVRALLREVGGYDPAAGAVKCVFSRETA